MEGEMRKLTLILLTASLGACQTVSYDSRVLSSPATSDSTSTNKNAVTTYSIGLYTEEDLDTLKNSRLFREVFGDRDVNEIRTTYTFPSQFITESTSAKTLKPQHKILWKTVSAESVASLTDEVEFAPGDKKEVKSPWDIAHSVLLANTKSFNQENPIFIIAEPDFHHENAFITAWHKSIEGETTNDHVPRSNYDIVQNRKKIWPGGSIPAWHMEDDKTQLFSAQKGIADIVDDMNRVQIAHLDTGYNPFDPLLPAYFQEEHSSDFTGQSGCSITGNGSGQSPGEQPSHGARTLSVLGGSNLNEYEHSSEALIIGGNPYAAIREYRIGKSVIHIRPKEMTEAIWCATENGVDIISISAGGFPSISQRNVVNDAYDKGVAIFAAAGNHYRLPILNISSPKTVVFPARYSRVMGVAGATHDETSYADSPSFWSQFLLFSWEDHIAPWVLRGNYGPNSIMADNMISAYSPNITTSYAQHQDRISISLQGAGTSNATPQVAAAASLWLQQEYPTMRNDISDQPWRKAEAIYHALSKSAATEFPDYEIEKFGAGVLRAQELMRTSYSDIRSKLAKRPPSSIGFRWIADAITSIPPEQTIDLQLAFKLDMLITEAAQVIYNREGFDRLIDASTNCLNYAENVGDCLDNEARLETIEILLGMDNISDNLRQHLTTLKENLSV